MFEKLEAIEKRFEELNEMLQDSEVTSNTENYIKLTKEYSELSELVEKYREYKKYKEQLEEAEELLKDPEMKELAQMDYEEAKDILPEIEEQLKIMLIPKDPNDNKNIVCEIRAGAGGDEAALFAATLYRMYQMYAERKGFKIDIINENETGLGGYKEITFLVNGKGAYSRFKFESGTHRVQRVPDTESSGRIHTSTATVAVLPEAEDVEVDFNMNDVRVDTFRASGAGGQHVNKTESAVRIVHLPTNTVVSCQSERSQIQNKARALKILKSKLYLIKQKEKDTIKKELKGEEKEVAFGSQIRSYVFQPYTMVKDHRTLCETGNIESVMNGELNNFIHHYLIYKVRKNGKNN